MQLFNQNILICKTGRVCCWDGVPKYWNNSRKHLQYKPFCFLFSVSVRTIPNYHATVTHFHRGGNDLKTLWKLHSTLYIYTAAAVVLLVRGFVPQAEDWVFESQSQQTSVVKTGSDSSIAKRLATGVGYHTYCDTSQPFIMVIFEDPWHSHLLPSV